MSYILPVLTELCRKTLHFLRECLETIWKYLCCRKIFSHYFAGGCEMNPGRIIHMAWSMHKNLGNWQYCYKDIRTKPNHSREWDGKPRILWLINYKMAGLPGDEKSFGKPAFFKPVFLLPTGRQWESGQEEALWNITLSTQSVLPYSPLSVSTWFQETCWQWTPGVFLIKQAPPGETRFARQLEYWNMPGNFSLAVARFSFAFVVVFV